MKFSSALTLTTIVSIMSTVHGAPVLGADPAHHRRHSSVSELPDRHLSGGADFMDSFGAAFEPGNAMGRLLNFVKRQIGSTDTTNISQASSGTTGSHSSSASTSTSDTGSSSSQPNTNNAQTETLTSGATGLMGGGLSSPQEAGFAYEPGQHLRTA